MTCGVEDTLLTRVCVGCHVVIVSLTVARSEVATTQPLIVQDLLLTANVITC